MYRDWTKFHTGVASTSRPRTITRILNHAIGDWTQIFRFHSNILSKRPGPGERIHFVHGENRIIGKSLGIICRRETKCGSVCEQLLAPYVAIQEVSDRLPFFLSLSLPIALPYFPPAEKKISYAQMSSFSRGLCSLLACTQLIEVIQSCLTVPPSSNEISIFAKRALRKKSVDRSLSIRATFRVRNSRCFLFPFFFLSSFCNRFGDP